MKDAVNLVNLFWLDGSRGSFYGFFTISTLLLEHSFMLKSYWWVVGGGMVAHVIIVSAPVQIIGFLELLHLV